MRRPAEVGARRDEAYLGWTRRGCFQDAAREDGAPAAWEQLALELVAWAFRASAAAWTQLALARAVRAQGLALVLEQASAQAVTVSSDPASRPACLLA